MADTKPWDFTNKAIPAGTDRVPFVQGAAVSVALYCDQSIEAQKALAQGVTGIYTLNFDKSLTLAYDEYLKRAKDNTYFRITSRPADNESPSVTTLNRRIATAERTELTT